MSLTQLDEYVLKYIKKNRNNGLNHVMKVVTSPITLAVFIIITTCQLKSSQKLKTVIRVVITCLVMGQLVIKQLVKRPRPNATYAIVKPLRDASYPSCHSMLAMAMATLSVKDALCVAPLCVFIASVISCSRVYVGVHYLSDVISGGVLGVCIANLYYKKKKR